MSDGQRQKEVAPAKRKGCDLIKCFCMMAVHLDLFMGSKGTTFLNRISCTLVPHDIFYVLVGFLPLKTLVKNFGSYDLF